MVAGKRPVDDGKFGLRVVDKDAENEFIVDAENDGIIAKQRCKYLTALLPSTFAE